MVESFDESIHKQKMLSSLPLMRVVDLRHALGQFGIKPSPKLRKIELTEMLKRAIQYQPLLSPAVAAENVPTPKVQETIQEVKTSSDPRSKDIVNSVLTRMVDDGQSIVASNADRAGSRSRVFLSSIEDDDYSEDRMASDAGDSRSNRINELSPSLGTRMRSWALETDLPVTDWQRGASTSDVLEDWDLAALKAELHEYAYPQAELATETAGLAEFAGSGAQAATNDSHLPARRHLAVPPAAGLATQSVRRQTEPGRPPLRRAAPAATQHSARPSAPTVSLLRARGRLGTGWQRLADNAEEEEDEEEEDEEEEEEEEEEEMMSGEALEALVARTDPGSLLGRILRAVLPAALYDLRPRPAPAQQPRQYPPRPRPAPAPQPRHVAPARPARGPRRMEWREPGRAGGGGWDAPP